MEERDRINRETHDFVDDQYDCWNGHLLRPRLAEHGIRVLGLHELDTAASLLSKRAEKGTRPLLTPVTVDPAHPFPRVINKALCVAFLLRRRRSRR